MLLERSILCKQSARPLVAALAFLFAAITVGGNNAEQHSYPDVSAQLSTQKHDRAEIVDPRQAPTLRLTSRPSPALRGKAPSKTKKPLALANRSTSWLASVRARPAVGCARAEPRGFLLLRTQNPRAPPIALILAPYRLA